MKTETKKSTCACGGSCGENCSCKNSSCDGNCDCQKNKNMTTIEKIERITKETEIYLNNLIYDDFSYNSSVRFFMCGISVEDMEAISKRYDKRIQIDANDSRLKINLSLLQERLYIEIVSVGIDLKMEWKPKIDR